MQTERPTAGDGGHMIYGCMQIERPKAGDRGHMTYGCMQTERPTAGDGRHMMSVALIFTKNQIKLGVLPEMLWLC